MLSAFAGVHAGRDLWHIPTQPVIAVLTTPNGLLPTAQHDTLTLGRGMASGILAGASGAYFPNPHFGIELEIALITETLESTCSFRRGQPADSSDIMPALCTSLQGQSISSSAVSFSAGLVGRLAAGKSMFPYVRLNGGVVVRDHSTLEMIGTYTTASGNSSSATLVADDHPSNTQPHITAALGLAFKLGPGYQFRLEGRDIMMRLDAPTGPGDPSTGTLLLPHSAKFYHIFGLTATLDVILEKQHKRRY